MIQSVWKNSTGLEKAKSYSQLNTSGVTLNADLEPKTHHQTPVNSSHFPPPGKTQHPGCEEFMQSFKIPGIQSLHPKILVRFPGVFAFHGTRSQWLRGSMVSGCKHE